MEIKIVGAKSCSRMRASTCTVSIKQNALVCPAPFEVASFEGLLPLGHALWRSRALSSASSSWALRHLKSLGNQPAIEKRSVQNSDCRGTLTLMSSSSLSGTSTAIFLFALVAL